MALGIVAKRGPLPGRPPEPLVTLASLPTQQPQPLVSPGALHCLEIKSNL